MIDVLARLGARAVGATPVVRPVIAPLFVTSSRLQAQREIAEDVPDIAAAEASSLEMSDADVLEMRSEPRPRAPRAAPARVETPPGVIADTPPRELPRQLETAPSDNPRPLQVAPVAPMRPIAPPSAPAAPPAHSRPPAAHVPPSVPPRASAPLPPPAPRELPPLARPIAPPARHDTTRAMPTADDSRPPIIPRRDDQPRRRDAVGVSQTADVLARLRLLRESVPATERAPAPPIVRVTIGRIDVGGPPPAPRGGAPPPPPAGGGGPPPPRDLAPTETRQTSPPSVACPTG